MSMFSSQTVKCPTCGTDAAFEAVESVNADRRPDLRQAILDESFQIESCPKCGKTFRPEPALTYLDVERGEWLAAYSPDELARWRQMEAEAEATFDGSFGPRAPARAQELGSNLKARVTFGWAALREKLFIWQEKLDDVTVELLKIALLRGLSGAPLSDDTELRLVDASPQALGLAWIDVPSETIAEILQVPRSLYDEIAADTESWTLQRGEFEGVLFVDLNRLLVDGGPAPAAEGATASA